MEALARRSRHPAHPGPLGKSPSTLSFPRANPKGTFQVRHQRTQPLGSGPHGPPSSCPQRVCVQWCTPSLSPLGSPVVCRGVRFPFDGAGPCSQPAPPLPHAPEFVIITIPLHTYTITLRVIRRLWGEHVSFLCYQCEERSGKILITLCVDNRFCLITFCIITSALDLDSA